MEPTHCEIVEMQAAPGGRRVIDKNPIVGGKVDEAGGKAASNALWPPVHPRTCVHHPRSKGKPTVENVR